MSEVITVAEGRLGGYQKYGFQTKWFDFWLLKIPKDVEVDWHRDPIPGREHHRCLISRKPICLVWLDGNYLYGRRSKHYRYENPCILVFRPDLIKHCVPPVSKQRWALTFGWSKKK